MKILDSDHCVAILPGRLDSFKAQLERTGTRLSDLDLQIASTALEHRRPLVTIALASALALA